MCTLPCPDGVGRCYTRCCDGGSVCAADGIQCVGSCPGGASCGTMCCAAGQTCENGQCVDAPHPHRNARPARLRCGTSNCCGEGPGLQRGRGVRGRLPGRRRLAAGRRPSVAPAGGDGGGSVPVVPGRDVPVRQRVHHRLPAWEVPGLQHLHLHQEAMRARHAQVRRQVCRHRERPRPLRRLRRQRGPDLRQWPLLPGALPGHAAPSAAATRSAAPVKRAVAARAPFVAPKVSAAAPVAAASVSSVSTPSMGAAARSTIRTATRCAARRGTSAPASGTAPAALRTLPSTAGRRRCASTTAGRARVCPRTLGQAGRLPCLIVRLRPVAGSLGR